MEENDDSGDANEAGKLRDGDEGAMAIRKFRGGNLIPTNTTNCFRGIYFILTLLLNLFHFSSFYALTTHTNQICIIITTHIY